MGRTFAWKTLPVSTFPEVTTALAWKDSFSTKKTTHVKTKMNVTTSQHAQMVVAQTLLVVSNVNVNKDSNPSMMARHVKMLMSVKEAHVDPVNVSILSEDSHAHVIMDLKSVTMEIVKILMSALKLVNVKTVTVSILMVDLCANVTKVIKKLVTAVCAMISMSALAEIIHVVKVPVRTWMASSNVSAPTDSYLDQMDHVKIRMNVLKKPTHADTENAATPLVVSYAPVQMITSSVKMENPALILVNPSVTNRYPSLMTLPSAVTL